jgi:hypothetical protein
VRRRVSQKSVLVREDQYYSELTEICLVAFLSTFLSIGELVMLYKALFHQDEATGVVLGEPWQPVTRTGTGLRDISPISFDISQQISSYLIPSPPSLPIFHHSQISQWIQATSLLLKRPREVSPDESYMPIMKPLEPSQQGKTVIKAYQKRSATRHMATLRLYLETISSILSITGIGSIVQVNNVLWRMLNAFAIHQIRSAWPRETIYGKKPSYTSAMKMFF